jgi:hypothetical protein
VPLYGDERALLVEAVHKVDRSLGLEIAGELGESAERMGIAPNPVAPKLDLTPHLIDAVVCAAADVAALPPATLRPALRAAFERAQAVGLTVEALVQGLGSRPRPRR